LAHKKTPYQSWLAEGAAVFAVGGRWALVLFLAALPPTGLVALGWRGRLEHARQEARAFARFLLDRDAFRRLRLRRETLATELAELSRLAPEGPGPGETGGSRAK